MQESGFLYDSFRLYYEQGIRARDNNDIVGAKNKLKVAGEILLKLAKKSSGRLKETRLDRATRILDYAESLTSEPVAKSDAERVVKDWSIADIPNTRFDDIAGLDDVKQSIRMRVVLPMEHPEIFEMYNKNIGGGILLYGLPGTGKTMMAQAIANEINAKFYSVKCSDIVSKWFGEAERNIKSLFDSARRDERAIIFFDEFEAIGCKRDGDNSAMNRVVPELLSQIQGFGQNNNRLLFLAATNRPQDIDSALLRPGRFNELIYIPLPDEEARKFIINKSFKKIPLSSDVSIEEMVGLTAGFNCSDVVEFCDRAKDNAIIKSINQKGELFPITKSDIIYASGKVKSSVSKSDIISLSQFQKTYDDKNC